MQYPPWNTNPYLNPYVHQQPAMLQQPTNGIIKANGPESAMQYVMGPNSISPAIFDEGGKVFYVVSTDGMGAKTVETFDFSPHVEPEHVEVDGATFVSKAEFDEFARKVYAVIGAGNGTDATVQPAAE